MINMIQNELLPGCGVYMTDVNYMQIEWIYGFMKANAPALYKPIPLTAESVAKVEGAKKLKLNGSWGFEFWIGSYVVEVYNGNVVLSPTESGDTLEHITSIHQLQILIYSLTGTMPKYDVL